MRELSSSGVLVPAGLRSSPGPLRTQPHQQVTHDRVTHEPGHSRPGIIDRPPNTRDHLPATQNPAHQPVTPQPVTPQPVTRDRVTRPERTDRKWDHRFRSVRIPRNPSDRCMRSCCWDRRSLDPCTDPHTSGRIRTRKTLRCRSFHRDNHRSRLGRHSRNHSRHRRLHCPDNPHRNPPDIRTRRANRCR